MLPFAKLLDEKYIFNNYDVKQHFNLFYIKNIISEYSHIIKNFINYLDLIQVTNVDEFYNDLREKVADEYEKKNLVIYNGLILSETELSMILLQFRLKK